MKRRFVMWVLFLTLYPTLLPVTHFVQASGFSIPERDVKNGFDPNAILTDSDIFDSTRMDVAAIRTFLNEKGVLNKRKLKDIDGVEKEPAEIIMRVAASYKLNPQYLLALLQKEQSLVESSSISERALDWATGFGVCDSCSKDDPRIQDFKGFASQLEYAAKQHRERYLIQLLGKGSTISGHAPGRTVLISGREITPVNNATAMLYTYTPHIHGNLNLWRIWKRWFSLDVPEGTLAKTPENEYFLIRLGKRRPIASRSIANSLVAPEKIVALPESDLLKYPLGASIDFPNYSLVENASGTRYLLVDGKKRLIANTTVFRQLGFIEDDLVEITDEALSSYEDGTDIQSSKQYPTGLLVIDPKKNYWFIQDGVKQAINDKAVLQLYFKGRKAKALDQKTLDGFKTGTAYQLRDGELVRTSNSNAVFVIENGLRRPIASGAVFERFGWKWNNITTLSPAYLNSYPLGETVTVEEPKPLSEPLF